jgi:hypothetical protein
MKYSFIVPTLQRWNAAEDRVRWGEVRTPTFSNIRYSSTTHCYPIRFGFIAYVCVVSLLAGVRSSPQPTDTPTFPNPVRRVDPVR